MLETIRQHSGSILLAFFAVALILALGLGLAKLIPLLGGMDNSSTALPILAITGVISLIVVLTIVAMIFWMLGLTNGAQAMGLPEGSIRAVIALSLIVLFAILSVFLYQGVSGASMAKASLNTIPHLTDEEKTRFLADHPTLRELQIVVAKDAADQPLKNPNGKPGFLYNVSYRSANPVSEDFAKQLLVLLGTLMTAITSFYLGAGTATSAAAAVQTSDASDSVPRLTGVNPTQHSLGTGSTIRLEVMGSNLNTITHAKIVRAGVQVIAKNVKSSPTSLTCDVEIDATVTPPGDAPWDVVVDDGKSKFATLPAALTIKA